jgi:hypothetical protein
MATRKTSTSPPDTSVAAGAAADTSGSALGNPRRVAATSGPTDLHKAENAMNRILLVDLGERELKERQKLRARQQILETIDETQSTSGGLSVPQEDERKGIEETLSNDIVADPFYRTVAATCAQRSWEDLADETCGANDNGFVHKYGLIGTQRVDAVSDLIPAEREIIGICGLMQLDGITDDRSRVFVQKVSIAQGEYRQHRALFDKAFALLSRKYEVTLNSQIRANLIDKDIIGCVKPGGPPTSRRNQANTPIPEKVDKVYVLSGRNVAAVVRKLAADGVSADDPWLASRIENGYEMQSGVVGGAPPSSFDIPLPDLEEATDSEIVRENLDAAQAIYFAYQLEEARMPQVVERIVELFRAGLLPLSYGKVGDYLYGYYKKASERITEGERRDLYMRAFGAPGGDPSINQPNREFNDLWWRFVSSVSSFGRQLTVDRMFRSQIPLSVSQEQVRKAARDLAASLSRNCYGIAYQFSKELKTLIIEYRDLLSDQEIRTSFGARDMWQVIDQVNANYLGGTRNSHRYRTQAKCGAIIIGWLAQNHQRLTNRLGEVISTNALTNPQLRGSDRPMEDPTDWDLLQACEQLIAVGGIGDQRVEDFSQPVESPTITSKPIEVPQVARDMLDAAGISLPSF